MPTFSDGFLCTRARGTVTAFIIRSAVALAVLALLASGCAKSPEEQARDERIQASIAQLEELIDEDASATASPDEEELIDEGASAIASPDEEELIDEGASAIASPDEEELIDEGASGTASPDEVRAFEKCLESIDFSAVLGDVDPTERIAMLNAAINCEVDVTTVPSFVASFRATIELALGGVLTLSDEEAACVFNFVVENSDDPARTFLVAETEADVQVFGDGVNACFTEENRAIVFGEDGPTAYGDDPRFDKMYDECEAGDMRVCDLLFHSTVFGSEYELLGFECAGRGRVTTTSCSPEGDYDQATGFAPRDAPGLDVLAVDCVAGDFTACDLLFMLSEIGDPRESVAFTCGERLVTGGLPDCRTALGQ